MKTTKPKYSATLHLDGTITFWNVYTQQWQTQPIASISGDNLRSMSAKSQRRALKRMTAREVFNIAQQ